MRSLIDSKQVFCLLHSCNLTFQDPMLPLVCCGQVTNTHTTKHFQEERDQTAGSHHTSKWGVNSRILWRWCFVDLRVCWALASPFCSYSCTTISLSMCVPKIAAIRWQTRALALSPFDRCARSMVTLALTSSHGCRQAQVSCRPTKLLFFRLRMHRYASCQLVSHVHFRSSELVQLWLVLSGNISSIDLDNIEASF